MMGLLASQLGSMKNPQILLRQSLPSASSVAAPSSVLSTVVLTKAEAASAKEDAAKAGQAQSK